MLSKYSMIRTAIDDCAPHELKFSVGRNTISCIGWLPRSIPGIVGNRLRQALFTTALFSLIASPAVGFGAERLVFAETFMNPM